MSSIWKPSRRISIFFVWKTLFPGQRAKTLLKRLSRKLRQRTPIRHGQKYQNQTLRFFWIPKEYESFCKSRAYLENCEERLETIKTATGFSKETFKALPRADKIFITVYARKTDNSIILKKSGFTGSGNYRACQVLF